MRTLVATCLVLAAASGGLAVPVSPGSVLRRRLGVSASPHGSAVRSPVRRPASLVARARRRGAAVLHARRDRLHRRAAVREACEAIAAELRAGRSPTRALEAATSVLPDLASVASVSRMGGDISTALRAVDAPGSAPLAKLAVAWSVAADAGAGLATVVDRVANDLRAEEELRAEVTSQLAGARASARMLAALPLLGPLLGVGAGSSPVGFLLASPSGLACLVSGCALAGVGLLWVERLARGAERLS